MAGNEVRLANEIRRSDRARAEAQMRNRHRAGFLRIVNKIALRKIVGVLADDFDRFLVRAHGAVRSEPKELRAHNVVRLDREIRIEVEAGMREIVIDAER